MKVTAISDLHGNLIDIEPCDILVICGDISPLDIQRDYIQFTHWFFSTFQTWIKEIPCDKVFLTPGNHDFWFEKMFSQSYTSLFDKLVILINEEYNYYSGDDDKWYKIYATPVCKTFGKWAYMPGNSELKSYYNNIPTDVDILLCHDSPSIGEIGNIHVGDDNLPVGNKILAEEIEAKKPKYVLSGHIHSGDHNMITYNETKLANVSILDEDYKLFYKPLTFII